jgi:excisionase family DNA binding protein
MKGVYTVREFANLVGIHEQTVYEKIKMKEIKRVPNIGRSVRIPASEVKKFLPDYQSGKTAREQQLEDENTSLKSELEKYKELIRSISFGLLKLNS